MRFCCLAFFVATLVSSMETSLQAKLDPGRLAASMSRLLGSNDAFTAEVELTVQKKGRTETLPLSIFWLKGKLRADSDLSRIRSERLPSRRLAALKKAGLEKVSAIILPERAQTYFISHGLGAYAELEAIASVEPAALKVAEAYLAREAVNGRACTKSQVTIRQGNHDFNVLVWRAENQFPVKLQFAEDGKEVVLDFKKVDLRPPPSARFQAPQNFSRHPNIQTLFAAAMAKLIVAGGH